MIDLGVPRLTNVGLREHRNAAHPHLTERSLEVHMMTEPDLIITGCQPTVVLRLFITTTSWSVS